jgi:myosin heavy subunit
MPFNDKIAQIKAYIKQVSAVVERLHEENLRLKGKVLEYEQLLEQKEIELHENKKKLQLLSAVERENRQFQMDRENLQKAVDQMIEGLKGF